MINFRSHCVAVASTSLVGSGSRMQGRGHAGPVGLPVVWALAAQRQDTLR
jgi:hypothetical protein